MQRSIWVFGLLAGAICALLEYLFFKSANASGNVMYIAKFVVLIIFIAFGLIYLRKITGGTLSIARTLFSGIMIALVRALVMISAFTFFYYPNGDFYQEKLEISFEQAALKINSDSEIKPADKQMIIEETQSQIAHQYTPTGYMLVTIGMSLVTGFIFSIFMAALISTNLMYNRT